MTEAPSARQSQDREPSPVPAITLPKGGGAIRGIGEKFAANPVTGTGSMTVPIATSPGRRGFGPQLAVSYDSGSGNGAFGFGWSLGLPAITRKTDKGLPQYHDGTESEVFLLSGAEDLVPVPQENGDLDDLATAPGYAIRRYRPRIEGLFARIERWTSTANREDMHWRSWSRDNLLTLYGKDCTARIYDPADPSRIFSWLICETRDTKGNAVIYCYKAEDGAQVDLTSPAERNRGGRNDPRRAVNRYLKRIRYANRVPLLDADGLRPRFLTNDQLDHADWCFEVVFDYGEHDLNAPLPDDKKGPNWHRRPDPFSTCRPGFEVRTYRLCRRVLMFHHFLGEPGVGCDCLVRSIDFGYATSPVASFLVSVTQRGYRRDGTGYICRSMPTVEFGYSEAVIDDTIHDVDAGTLENLPTGIDGAVYRLVDLDSEGLEGVLADAGGGWRYKPNLGGGRFGAMRLTGPQPSTTALGSGGQQLLDLAGDGSLNLVSFSGPTPGFSERTDGTWDLYQPFRSLPQIAWDDPGLRMVDLTGDGLADVLLTEDDVFTWYPSLGEDGFAEARRVHQPRDEDQGPRLVDADGIQQIYLADMSGDGLNNLVRVRNGEVCYWPSLGYGRFGAKITMANAPVFDQPDQFSQRRLRVADIDGSGTTDLIYLGRDGARLYFNQSGNGWSDARRLSRFPPVDDLATVTTADLLGNGTACLVWSSPLPQYQGRQLRYIDLMGGQKPHLLVRTVNNLGAETHIRYVPSTQFYLRDKAAGRPWITRLPFPVHVIERVETYDRISRNRFVTRYAYHHGYFDGVERELRGFAMVEQWDTESFAALSQSTSFPVGDNIDAASHVPPVHTKTWFHTGIHLGRGRVSNFFAGLLDNRDIGEYYREPAWRDNDDEARKRLLDDTVLPPGLTLDEEREACRALKGSMLRQEIYAEDGTDKADHPYTVSEQNFTVRMLQARRGNRHAVFFVHPREAVNYHYERNPADPRTSHTLTLEVDSFGNALKAAAIAYGRRQADASLPLDADQDKQTTPLITYTENRVTEPVPGDDEHHAPLPAETCSYELTGYPLTGTRFLFDHGDFVKPDPNDPARLLHIFDEEIKYEARATKGRQRRLIEQVRTLYRKNDLTGLLDLGKLQSLALPGESYKLAFTAGLVDAYGGRVDATTLAAAGYVRLTGDTGWWVPSGRVFFSPDPTDTAEQELAVARAGFYLPRRQRSALDAEGMPVDALVEYDAHHLLTRETTDALGNKVTAGERDIDPSQPAAVTGLDYRVLQPALVMDPNRNRTALAFDALGLVVAIAVMGKPEDVPAVGDLLGSDLEVDPTQAQVFGAVQDPRGTVAAALLGDATTRVVYDVDAYKRSRDSDDPRPAVALSISRESHVSQGKPPGGVRRQIRLVYADGGGAEIQRKAQVGDGPVPVRDAAGSVVLDDDGQPTMTTSDVPRWACSGWSIRNNKGLVVRQFEPFFTDTPRYEFDLRIGTGPILMYDPLGRLIATVRADHAWQKTVFDQWRQVIWDVNDTLLISDPARDADVGASISKLPPADYLPTWYGLRADPASAAARARRWPEANARAAEQAAAQQAAIHAATPTTVHTDALGRAVLTISHNRFQYGDDPPGSPPTERFESTRLVLDTEGRQRELIDAYDRVVRRCVYDMLGRRLVEVTIDAGTRWSFTDVIGQPIASWDSSGAAFRNEYDALRRPLRTFVSSPGQPESLVGRSVYGEQHPAPEARNLRSHAFLRFDPAGVTGSEAYDFKGNLLTSSRRMTVDYRGEVDWSQVNAVIPSSSSMLDPVTLAATVNTLLDSDTFTARTEFDALNRPTIGVTPDASVTRPQYDLGGHLNSVEVNLLGATSAGQPVWTPFVTSIRYNAFGQREQCARHDSTGATPDLTTTYSYEPRTHRLLGVITASRARSVQDLRYFYDPSGNVTRRDDGAQQTLFFRNKRVEPSSDFSYDACYRLVEATGRELLPTGPRLPPSWNDASAISPSQPGDGNTLGRYVERYHYDPVGNITQMLHRGPDPTQAGWTRTYKYSEPSKLDVTVFGNRLTSSTVAAAQPVVEAMAYDERGNLTQLPHLVAGAADSMQWDALGRLRKVSLGGGGTVFYQYDAGGQRVRKIWEKPGGLVEERLYLGPFERFTERLHGQPQLVRDTLHVADGERRVAIVEDRRLDVAGNDPAPERLTRYQLTDQLGSVVLELDAAGQILSYEEYTPYGSTSYSSAVAPMPKRYQYIGKERDGETGLYYFGSRYYPPWLGRWISCDPAGAEGSINSYGYAAGNPVTLVDPDGAAPLPQEAAALFTDGKRMLSGKGFHLDQGSNQALLLEAQAGGIVRENIEKGELHKAGTYYQHLQGAQENVGGARKLSYKIDSYVGKAQLGEETSASLKGLSRRLWQAADTTEDTIAAAEALAAHPEWSKRFEGMTFKAGQLITAQLPQMLAEHGAPATLLPEAAQFEGVLEGIGNLAVRGSAPVGINLFNGPLGFIQQFFESAAWEKIASKASSVASEAAERGAAASEWIAAKGVTAGAWLATKGSAAIEVGSKFAGYLLVFLAIKGGDNATKSLLSVEKNQQLNVYYTSKDTPPTGQQLLFQLAVTGVGLADALSVDVRAGVGDWDWGKEVGETFMNIGMSPTQRDFTEWMRVELGLVPGGQR